MSPSSKNNEDERRVLLENTGTCLPTAQCPILKVYNLNAEKSLFNKFLGELMLLYQIEVFINSELCEIAS
jgi:hypothetical protein